MVPAGIPREVVVLAGGDAADLPHPDLADDALVIAADGGLSLASQLGVQADIVTGDMDSVDPATLASAREAGASIDTHPVDKDRTDLAIALDLALAHGATAVTVVGGHGGRLDHHLANLLLLASDAYASLRMTAYMGPAVVTVIRDERSLTGRPGDIVSLLPVHGPVRGVTTAGLRFALDEEELQAGTSRGVSNEFSTRRARVGIADGVLLAIQPG